jgi:pantoate--beta-alanine ligase
MGALHEGHLALVREAHRLAKRVTVSIFVNPAQFGAGEDLGRYPKTLEADLAALKALKVDGVFTPDAERMYPAGFQTWVQVEDLTAPLCGASRPGHFRGVTTVVAKFFNIVAPDIAVFGQKDYQQAAVVARMTRDLDFPVRIVTVPTVREADGLAMSSRNRFLSTVERERALALPAAIEAARLAAERGAAPGEARSAALDRLAAEPELRLDYLECLDAETLGQAVSFERPVLIAGAVFIGKTRLIDNCVFPGGRR